MKNETANNKIISNNSQNNTTDTELYLIVAETLSEIGFRFTRRGYLYLRDAVTLVVENSNLIISPAKNLYPLIAKEYSTTTSIVSARIRRIIKRVWEEGDADILKSYFNNINKKPTTTQFIKMISDKIRLKLEKQY